eukprot:TRINITY_DN5550_c0_g1_i3.p1 TRINITY_DN5550_c0_g1~~TRINITY_DN5550_c0_g1_i3.p1  ORF type:complete len:195 (-),score=28.07 TRINITY_DN5550_c0_g1_i3:215-799(-)
MMCQNDFSLITYTHVSTYLQYTQGVSSFYTDPQIHSPIAGQFGDGDLGQSGISRFFSTHQCNSICRKIGLPENKPRVSQARVHGFGIEPHAMGHGIPMMGPSVVAKLALLLGHREIPAMGFFPGMSRILPHTRGINPMAQVDDIAQSQKDELQRVMEISRKEYEIEQQRRQGNRGQASREQKGASPARHMHGRR